MAITRKLSDPQLDGPPVPLSGTEAHRAIASGTYGAPYWVTLRLTGQTDVIVGPVDNTRPFIWQGIYDEITAHSSDPSGTTVGRDLVSEWDVLAVTGRDLVSEWNIEEIVGKSGLFEWDMGGTVGRSLSLGWHVGDQSQPEGFNTSDFTGLVHSYHPFEQFDGKTDAEVKTLLKTQNTHGYNGGASFTLAELVDEPSPAGGPGGYLSAGPDDHFGIAIFKHRKHFGENFGTGNITHTRSLSPLVQDLWVFQTIRFAVTKGQQAGDDAKLLSDVNRYYDTSPFHRWRAWRSPNPTYSGVLQNGDTEFVVSPSPGWATDAHVGKQYLLLKSSYDPGPSDFSQQRTPPKRADVADSFYEVNAEPEQEWWGTPPRARIIANTADTLTFERAVDPSSAKLLLDWQGSSAGRKLTFIHQENSNRTMRIEMVQAGFTLDGTIYTGVVDDGSSMFPNSYSNQLTPDLNTHPDGFRPPQPFTGLGNINPPGLGGIWNRALSNGDWMEMAMHYCISDDFGSGCLMHAFRRLTDDAGAFNPSRWYFRRAVQRWTGTNPVTRHFANKVTNLNNINIFNGTFQNLPTGPNPLGGSYEVSGPYFYVDGKQMSDPRGIYAQLNEDPGTNIPTSFPYDL